MKSYALILGLSTLVAAGVFFLQRQSSCRLQEQNQTLSDQLERMAQLRSENEHLSNVVAQMGASPSETPDRELLRLRAEVARLHLQTNEIARLERENRALIAGLKQEDKDKLKLARLIRERQDAFADDVYYVTNAAGFWFTPDMLQPGTVFLGPGGIRIWPPDPEANTIVHESTANHEAAQNAAANQPSASERGILITPDMFQPGTALHLPGGVIVRVP